MDPPRVICADRTSLLDLPSRELICFHLETFLTPSQNRYTPILYQTWLFGSHVTRFCITATQGLMLRHPM